MQINIQKSHLGILTILIIVFAGIFVWAYTQSIPNPGHGANTIWITNKSGAEKTIMSGFVTGYVINDDSSKPSLNKRLMEILT